MNHLFSLYRHCSLTELEIIKASFRERTDHGYFYFRDPAHLEEQSLDMNTSQRALLMEIYESESEFATKKIRDLKQQIIDTGNEGILGPFMWNKISRDSHKTRA